MCVVRHTLCLILEKSSTYEKFIVYPANTRLKTFRDFYRAYTIYELQLHRHLNGHYYRGIEKNNANRYESSKSYRVENDKTFSIQPLVSVHIFFNFIHFLPFRRPLAAAAERERSL